MKRILLSCGTLSLKLTALHAAGYTHAFSVKGDKLCIGDCTTFCITDIDTVEWLVQDHDDGMPGDELMIYVIVLSCGLRGYLIDNCGIYADSCTYRFFCGVPKQSVF